MAQALQVRGVSRSFGEQEVLRDVSFEIPRGAMVTLAGRSGSGKSTLFKLVAGLDRPTRGEILVEGTDIASLNDAAMSDIRLRRLGIVFQSFNLLPDSTVLENVRLPLDIAGAPRRDADERARGLLEMLHIGDKADRLPNVLSGGETQRAAIARALANNPALLLADEPTGSLDVFHATTVMDAFREVNAKLGTTVLLVTHDPALLDSDLPKLELVDKRVRWVRPL